LRGLQPISQTVEKTVKDRVFLFPDAEIMQNLAREMTSPNKTERKSFDDIVRDRARRLTQRVLTDQRHLEKIGREVNGI